MELNLTYTINNVLQTLNAVLTQNPVVLEGNVTIVIDGYDLWSWSEIYDVIEEWDYTFTIYDINDN